MVKARTARVWPAPVKLTVEISGVPAGDHHLTVIPPTGYVGTAVESIHVAGEEGIDRSYTLNQAASVIYLPLVTSE